MKDLCPNLFLKLQNQFHGNLKNIYMKLIAPVVIAAILLAIISYK